MIFNNSKVYGVAVHNFVFHADDVVSVALLKAVGINGFDIVRISQSVRTEDGKFIANPELPKLEAQGYILMDVGNGEFDHHCLHKECYDNGIPMASCGKVLRKMVEEGLISSFQEKYLLNHGVYALQAQDNGHDLENMSHPFSFIGYLNGDPLNEDSQMINFLRAVEIAEEILRKMLESAAQAEIDVEDFLASIGEDKVARLPRYMKNAATFAIMANAAAMNEKKVEFYTWPSRNGGVMLSSVKVEGGKFSNLIDLPASLAGKHGAQTILGLDDFIFEHPGRWIAEAGSQQSIEKIIEMAREEQMK